MLLFCIFGIPVILTAGILVIRKPQAFGVVNAAGYGGVFLAGLVLLLKTTFARETIAIFGFIYVDALSAFFIFVVSAVAFATALYSIGYINKDIENEVISQRKARIYYLLFNAF